MAWTTPATQTTGTLVTAALWNTHVTDNMTFLGGSHNHSGDAGDGATLSPIPSGMIAIFDAACPSGWTRVSAWDGIMIRGAATYGGTGGASTHTHTSPAHTHNTPTHNHASTSHTHTMPAHTHDQSNAGTVTGNAGTNIAAESVISSIMRQHVGSGSNAWSYIAAGFQSGGAIATAASTGDTDTKAASATASGGDVATGNGSSFPAYITVVFCKRN